MKYKYLISSDSIGKINYVGYYDNENIFIFEKINNKNNVNKYVKQLKKINKRFGGDLFDAINNREIELVKISFFEEKEQENNKNHENLYVTFTELDGFDISNKIKLDDVLESVKDNSYSFESGTNDENNGLAKILVDSVREMRPIGPVGNIALDGRINFIHIVDEQGNYVKNSYTRNLEDKIAVVSFRPFLNSDFVVNDMQKIAMSKYTTGFVSFSKFAEDLNKLGYSLADYDDPGFISDLYDEDNELDLFSIKNTNICYNDSFKCEFVKTDNLLNQTLGAKKI